MKIETIYLPDQVILIDKEAEIKEGNYYLFENILYQAKSSNENRDKCSKIIAANPAIGDLPLLPLPDDEVEKLADDWYCKEFDFESVRNTKDGLNILKRHRKNFIAGYKAAKQNSFTKEDIMVWYKYVKTHTCQEAFEYLEKKKQKPQFFPEMICDGKCAINDCHCKYIGTSIPKIVDGVMQGTWK